MLVGSVSARRRVLAIKATVHTKESSEYKFLVRLKCNERHLIDGIILFQCRRTNSNFLFNFGNVDLTQVCPRYIENIVGFRIFSGDLLFQEYHFMTKKYALFHLAVKQCILNGGSLIKELLLKSHGES